MAAALSRSLKGLPLQPSDAAAVQLAKQYAVAIDDAHVLDRLTPQQVQVLDDLGMLRYAAALDGAEALKALGPKFLEALAELGMTPKARTAVVRGAVTSNGDSDKITELRSRRTNRGAHMEQASS
jgi:hypothetical protein